MVLSMKSTVAVSLHEKLPCVLMVSDLNRPITLGAQSGNMDLGDGLPPYEENKNYYAEYWKLYLQNE